MKGNWDGVGDSDPERTSPLELEAPEVECEAAAAARRLPVSDCALADLQEVEKEEGEVLHVDEALEDLPAAADAAEGLDGAVEGVLLEDPVLLRPRRDQDLWAGVDVCLEVEELEELLPQRRQRPSRRV